MNRTLAVVITAALVVVAPLARADGADKELDRGVDLRRSGHDAEALDVFKRVLETAPSPRAYGQTALAEQALHLWVDAERHLDEALARAEDPWVRQNRAVLEQARAVVARHLGTVDVHVDAPRAELRVNGAPAGTLPLARPLRVVSGMVTLEISAPDRAPATRRLQVVADGAVRVDVALDPAAPERAPLPGRAPEPARSGPASGPFPAVATAAGPESAGGLGGRRVAALALGGAGLVGVGIGTFFGVRAIDLKAQRDAACDVNVRCSPAGVTADRDGRSAATVSTVVLAIGGAAVAAGAVLWLTAPARQSVALAPAPGGATLHGTF